MFEFFFLNVNLNQCTNIHLTIKIGMLFIPPQFIVIYLRYWPIPIVFTGLKKNGLSPEKIQYCVCTHGHSDHVGNLSLFDKAVHILSYDVCTGDKYHNHDFKTVCCFQLFGIIPSLFNLIHSLIKLQNYQMQILIGTE